MFIMENQHKKIKGYNSLSQEQIDLMNEVKTKGNELGALIDKLQGKEDIDSRWLNIGKTDCQKGIMSIVRSITKPDSFS